MGTIHLIRVVWRKSIHKFHKKGFCGIVGRSFLEAWMKKCGVCGGVFADEECPYGQAEELPWAEDYRMMGQGKLEHGEHQQNVARWVLHTRGEHAESVLEWAKNKMEALK